jgi:hypothetical protein
MVFSYMSAKRQHYVPHFLLRYFSGNDKGQLYVFDKTKHKAFQANPINLAVISNYYDFNFHDEQLTLEPALAELEGTASQHISRIITNRRLSPLDPFERGELARFFAVQLVRTPAKEAEFDDISRQIEKYLRDQGMPDTFFEKDPAMGEDENVKRISRARTIYNAPEHFGALLAHKDWVLIESNPNTPYIMGDHPLTMYNPIQRLGRGNLGLKVEGIQLYFPLSPDLTLSLLCPSYYQIFLEGIEKISNFSEMNSNMPRKLIEAWKYAVDFVEAVQTGKPIKSTPENVIFFNSLQISTAERFIFSSVNDFSLVQDMVQDNEELRHGCRLQEVTGKF